METYFLSCKCTLARSLLRAPQMAHACFGGATCVMTTTHGVQSSFFEEILKPTMSLLPAADWLLSSKYLLLLFTYCALDDGSDYSWRCHRSRQQSCPAIRLLSTMNIPRGASLHGSSTTSYSSNSVAVITRLPNYFYLCYF
mgnify:CR=1 FL=1